MSKYMYECTDEEQYEMMNEIMEIIYEREIDKILAKKEEEERK